MTRARSRIQRFVGRIHPFYLAESAQLYNRIVHSKRRLEYDIRGTTITKTDPDDLSPGFGRGSEG